MISKYSADEEVDQSSNSIKIAEGMVKMDANIGFDWFKKYPKPEKEDDVVSQPAPVTPEVPVADDSAEAEPAIPVPTAEQKSAFAQIFRKFVKPRANPAPQQPVVQFK